MAKESMKSKMMASGGAKSGAKGYAGGGMAMVMKGGKKVPSFAADGVGKMAMGGMVKSKMMAGGGAVKSKMMAGGGMMKPKATAKGK